MIGLMSAARGAPSGALPALALLAALVLGRVARRLAERLLAMIDPSFATAPGAAEIAGALLSLPVMVQGLVALHATQAKERELWHKQQQLRQQRQQQQQRGQPTTVVEGNENDWERGPECPGSGVHIESQENLRSGTEDAAAQTRPCLTSKPSTQSDDVAPWWSWEEPQLDDAQQEALDMLMQSHFGPEAPQEVRGQLEHVMVNGDARAAALRALTARRFDVGAARKLVDDMLEWRRSEKVDGILGEPLPKETLRHLRSCLFDGFTGVCKEGFPVYVMLAGCMDLAECKKLVGVDTIVRYHVQVMEYLQKVHFVQVSRQVGRTANKVTLLLDLRGFGGHNVRPDFWEVMNALTKIDNVFYYEFLNRVLIVNAGLFFRFFWKTAAPLLDAKTKEKFTVVTQLADLERYIPGHQLPERFGGTVQDEGSFCTKETPWSHVYNAMDAHVEKVAAAEKEHQQ